MSYHLCITNHTCILRYSYTNLFVTYCIRDLNTLLSVDYYLSEFIIYYVDLLHVDI